MPPDDPAARPDAARGAGVPATPTVRLVGEALPAALAHLADGALGDALSKAIEYAQHSVSPATEKIYADDWGAFRAWCLDASAPPICRRRRRSSPPISPNAPARSAAAGCG